MKVVRGEDEKEKKKDETVRIGNSISFVDLLPTCSFHQDHSANWAPCFDSSDTMTMVISIPRVPTGFPFN